MIKHILRFFIYLFLFISVYISYLTFTSYQLQSLIEKDIRLETVSLSLSELETSNFNIPNINVYTIPMSAFKAYYLWKYNLPIQALNVLDSFSNPNPYLFFSEYIKSQVFKDLGKLDSSLIYAKKAFYGWPKVFNHYEHYNSLLVLKRDTTAIINAFGYIDSAFAKRQNYSSNFISSLAKAKLSYLVKYNSIRSISGHELHGSWERVLEYEGNNVKVIPNNSINFNNGIYTTLQDTLFYVLKNKSLLLSPLFRKNYILSKNQLLFSETFKTLIIIPPQESGPKQARFFKKIN